MKKYLISFLSVIIVISLIITVCFVGGGKEKIELQGFLSFSKQSFESTYDSSGVVCENDKWQLNWDDGTKRVSFTDKETGYEWGQIPQEAKEPIMIDGMMKKNHPQMESVVHVVYQDPKSFDDDNAYSYTAAVQNDGVYVQQIENGLRVTYEFNEKEFSVPVEYTITENSFKITVDPTKISEGEVYKIHSVALSPYLCGIRNDAEDSWLFMPDGTGTVIEPFTSDSVGFIGKDKYVYGKDLSYQTYSKPTPDEQINLPVYGVKKGDNAVLAVISSGAEAASIRWNVASDNICFSTIYPEFRIRGFSYIERPENFVTTTTLGAFKILSDGIVTKPLEIEYFALSGEKANINGMAECYREYLIKNSGLTKNYSDEKTATFKYIGAVVQPSFVLGVPTDKLFPLTTTEQALAMTEELGGKIGNDLNIQLSGFGETGIDIGEIAGGYSVASNLGGTNGIEKLVKSLNDKKINSFMDFDLISFSESGSGFDKSSAAVYHGGQVVKYTSFDTVSKSANQDRFYVLSRDNLFAASSKLNEEAHDLGISGISLTSLSNTVYSDYSNQKYYINGNMADDVAKIFKSTSKAGFKTLSTAANDYAAVNSDYINDVPLYSSKYSISSYDVPFYQLVFKGYRPMSSVSLNLCSDKKDALLRCVESGISPSYTLYYNFDKELVTNEHSFIFGSHFEGNRDDIVTSVNSVKDYLNSIEGATVTEYIRLSKTASVTKFDNGVYAVVNFGESEITTDYGKVPAKSYITGRGE